MMSNDVIVPSVLNTTPKNMTWNDPWETKLFLEDNKTLWKRLFERGCTKRMRSLLFV